MPNTIKTRAAKSTPTRVVAVGPAYEARRKQFAAAKALREERLKQFAASVKTKPLPQKTRS